MKARYLLNVARTGLATRSCEGLAWADGVPLNKGHVAQWLAKDPHFAARYNDAMTAYGESLEVEAHRRAVLGVEKVVYWRGEEIGTIREFSDQLLIMLMKANNPDKYRDRVDIRVDVQAEIKRMAEEMGVPVEIAEAEWRALEPRLLGKGAPQRSGE